MVRAVKHIQAIARVNLSPNSECFSHAFFTRRNLMVCGELSLAIISPRSSRGFPMNVKNAMLAASFGGACLITITSASALPIASVPGDATATQVGSDDAGDIAGRVIRGLGGPGSYRDRDYDRRRYRDRDYDRGRYRDRDYDRGRYPDRDYDRRRD
jgi:hypothetical protein